MDEDEVEDMVEDEDECVINAIIDEVQPRLTIEHEVEDDIQLIEVMQMVVADELEDDDCSQISHENHMCIEIDDDEVVLMQVVVDELDETEIDEVLQNSDEVDEVLIGKIIVFDETDAHEQ